MLFCVFVPHCRLLFARGWLLYCLEINYRVYYCLGFGLFIIYASHDISKLLTVIEAIRDNAISF
jgi:hypothetical protein